MNYTPEQFDKLPQWARNEINFQKGSVEYLTKKLAQFTGEAETNTYLVVGVDNKPLPKNAQVEFRVGDRQLNRVNVMVMRNGMVNINTDSRMGHSMVMLPRGANSFYIHFVETK